MTREQALQQEQAEGITLRKADNKSGYASVSVRLGRPEPYHAKVERGGNQVQLGTFATAEEAALCVARSPEGQAAAARAAAALPPKVPLTREQALQQAQVEGLTLQKADNQTGYVNVSVQAGSKPYQAKVRRVGIEVTLGSFITAEEAALCVARSPEGQEAAERAAAPPPKAPLTREQALQQAQAEGLVLQKADTRSGYAGVYPQPGRKPYKAQVRQGGNQVHLGNFATAEEAALSVARSPEGQVARAAAAPPPKVPLTREQALQQAQAEGITLRKANNKSGYANVSVLSGGSKPFQVTVRRSGRNVSLGSFATAEEAALSVARSLEGQVAAEQAATAPPTASSEQGKSKAPVKPPVKEEGSVPPMPLDAVVKEEDTVPPMPSEARWSDAIVKEEHELVNNGEQPKKKLKSR